jgi:hypothetical protein
MASISATFYFSFDDAERPLAKELTDQIRIAPSAAGYRFSDQDSTPAGAEEVAYRKQLIEAADVVVIFRSPAYFNNRHLHFEKTAALNSPRQPLVLVVNALPSSGMPGLEDYFQHLVPSPGILVRDSDPVEQAKRVQLAADIICQHTARFLASGRKDRAATAPRFTFEQMRQRLFSFISKNNLSAALHLLLRLVHDSALERAVFGAIEEHTRLHQQARKEHFDFYQFWQHTEAIRADLEGIVQRLEEPMLHPAWPQTFENEYLGFAKIEAEGVGMMGLFTQADDIIVPETRSAGDEKSAAERFLTEAQKLEYKRLFILAQDEEAVGRPHRAFHYCEQIKNTLDPESAQLYEHLLLNYAKKETPKSVVERALRKEGRSLDFVVLYAGRFKHYAQTKTCFSPTGHYNVAEVADGLANALRAAYAEVPNDYILDTGGNAARHPSAFERLLDCRRIATRLYNYVHTTEGFLEIMLNEICGGGKCLWLERVGVENGRFRVYNHEDFDLLGEIRSVKAQIAEPPAADPDNLVETSQRKWQQANSRRLDQMALLRENLLISLREKRDALRREVERERRYRREFIDEHESIARYVYACLTGYLAFDDDPLPGRPAKSEFLDLALHELVRQPSAAWFSLSENGQLVTHDKHRSLRFEAFELTECIIEHFAGQRGLHDVRAQLKETAYRQLIEQATAEHQEVATGLQWTDIRRMKDFEARHRLIGCFRHWLTLYRAYPERGQIFVENILREVLGDGLLLWLQHDPDALVNHPDNLTLGYDAQAELRALLDLSTGCTEAAARERIAENLFQRRIKTAYEAVRAGAEAQRGAVVTLLLESLSGYRLHADPRYLDFVFGELTEEHKFRWVNVGEDGKAKAWTFQTARPFAPLEVLEGLAAIDPKRYSRYLARERIAARRHADQLERYFQEISEFRQENRRPERAIAIDVLRKMRGIFLYFPKEDFLRLSVRELTGKGRIRWNALFLGFFPTRENHFENKFYHFNYRFELFEVKRLLQHHYVEMERVMRECGEL